MNYFTHPHPLALWLDKELRNPRFLTIFLYVALSLPLQAQFVDFQSFPNSGLNSNAGSPQGINVEDFDGDGWIDLIVFNGGTNYMGYNLLYRNIGGSFQDVSATALPEPEGKFSIGAYGDYNDDGQLDLYAPTWHTSTLVGSENRLLLNNGDGSFSNAGPTPPNTDLQISNGCSWADINGDGWLDLFVANFGLGFGSGPNALYRNNGNGTFNTISEDIIITDAPGFSFSGNWADVDSDGDLDLFVANAFSRNRLYRNKGDGTFELDTSPSHFNTTNAFAYSGSWGDYDNDGDLDIFVVGDPINYLYNNNGAGQFERITGPWEINLDTPSAAWADFDNDGDLDLFVTSFYNFQSKFYRNDGGQLVLETEASVPAHDGWAGVADFDNDGFLDLAISNGGFPGTTHRNIIYRNLGNENHWAQFNLVGIGPNTHAIGAVVRAKATINGAEVWQMRQVASSSHEPGSLRVHFGLEDAQAIDSLVIEWPDGEVEAYRCMEVDQFCTIVQGDYDNIDCSCEPLAIGERALLPAQLTLAPNPAKEYVHLSLQSEVYLETCTLRLFDMAGQPVRILQLPVNGQQLEQKVSLAGLPAGIYSLQLSAEAGQISETLVITP